MPPLVLTPRTTGGFPALDSAPVPLLVSVSLESARDVVARAVAGCRHRDGRGARARAAPAEKVERLDRLDARTRDGADEVGVRCHVRKGLPLYKHRLPPGGPQVGHAHERPF